MTIDDAILKLGAITCAFREGDRIEAHLGDEGEFVIQVSAKLAREIVEALEGVTNLLVDLNRQSIH